MQLNFTRKAIFVHWCQVPCLIDVDTEMVHMWPCKNKTYLVTLVYIYINCISMTMCHYRHHSLLKEQDTVGVLAPNIFEASVFEPFSFSPISAPCILNQSRHLCVVYLLMCHTMTCGCFLYTAKYLENQRAQIHFMLLCQLCRSYSTLLYS